MTKHELISALSGHKQAEGLSRKQVEALVDALFAALGDYFVASRSKRKNGARFAFPGFGTFTRRVRGARTVKNPNTGAPIAVPPTVTLAFAPSQKLRAALNRKRKNSP